MPDPLLQVQGVKKRFCRSLKRSLWYGVSDIASDLMMRSGGGLALRKQEFLAVDDVSFEVAAGESVALIGRNGAGKSTLLKLINGLFRPDAGQIAVRGRVSALIELGAGFNPVLSGRENIYINAAVLGMTKQEVDRQLEEIVDFSELEEFIDMPLKNYSSGMKVRLGFAVASQLQPDLLLIDEVLAVGDAAFRAKCYRRLSQLLSGGTAFVLVSHNNHMLLTTCSRGVVLDHGRMIDNAEISQALHAYERIMAEADETAAIKASDKPKGADTGLEIRDIYFRGAAGEPVREPKTGSAAALCIQVEVGEPLADVGMAVIIRESQQGGQALLALASSQDGIMHELDTGRHELRLNFDVLPLAPGRYVAKLSASKGALHTLDAVEAFQFGVDVGSPTGDSLFYCDRSWQVAAL